MKKGKGTGNHSLLDWQDAYYDGYLSNEDDFCEYSQTIVRRKKRNDGWDQLEEYKSSRKYWESVERDYHGVKY